MFQQIVLNGSSLFQSSNETCPEHDFWYTEEDPFTNTFVRKFDLVCSREYLRTLALSISGIGEMFGCLIFGYIADRFGRKLTLFSEGFLICIGGILTALATDVSMVIVGRFISGTSTINFYSTAFVLCCEFFPPKQRTILGPIASVGWAL